MEPKTIMGYHRGLTRMATVKKTPNNNFWGELAKQLGAPTLLQGIYIGANALENWKSILKLSIPKKYL